MNYIGNQASWITDELMNILQTCPGDPVPLWTPERWQGHPLLDDIRERGLKYFGNYIPQQFFHVFNSRSKDLNNYEFKMPDLPVIKEKIWWWFVKLNPGEVQLMHYDMHILGALHKDNQFLNVTETIPVIEPVRYTMYLQDWEPGHVFVWEDKINVKYKKGDIYEWSEPELYHGVANLSYQPRYTLQITMHD